MKEIIALIKKDFKIDWRQQNPITGILLYLFSTLFICYMSFQGMIKKDVWNALYWIILLFTSLNAVAKSFIQEEGRTLYYYFTVKPIHIVISKLIYSFLYVFILALVSLFIYSILLGNPISNNKQGLYIMNLLLGVIGLSSSFTMISAISFRTSNRMVMMAVLGFPIVIPVLILSISNAKHIMEGFIFQQIQGNIFSLLSVDVIIIALTFVLFPFTWKS